MGSLRVLVSLTPDTHVLFRGWMSTLYYKTELHLPWTTDLFSQQSFVLRCLPIQATPTLSDAQGWIAGSSRRPPKVSPETVPVVLLLSFYTTKLGHQPEEEKKTEPTPLSGPESTDHLRVEKDRSRGVDTVSAQQIWAGLTLATTTSIGSIDQLARVGSCACRVDGRLAGCLGSCRLLQTTRKPCKLMGSCRDFHKMVVFMLVPL